MLSLFTVALEAAGAVLLYFVGGLAMCFIRVAYERAVESLEIHNE